MINIEALKDFKFHSKISEETIKKYQGRIPDELMEVWKNYGYGSFYNGYLKIINPDEYQEILEESYFNGKISIPIFATGFGDIITWRSGEFVTLIIYRKNDIDVLVAGFEFFFGDLMTGKVLIRRLDKGLYEEALSRYGTLEYDECFGFVPLLPLGGSEKVDNLEKVKILPHIDLITQMVGRIE